MTIEQEQHLLILEKLLPTKDKRLYDHEFYNLVKDITGNSYDFIKKGLLANGYLEDGYNFIDEEKPETWPIENRTCYKIFLTDIGEKAYFILRKKKRNELIKTIAFWLTLIAAVISAGYGVATYYTNNNKQDDKLPTPTPQQNPLDTSQNLSQPDNQIKYRN